MTDFTTHRKAFQAALVALSEFIRVDERLSRGLDQGRLTFFGTADPRLLSGPDGQVLDPPKATRFLEWFSLERPLGESAAAPVHAFVASGCPALDPELQAYGRSLADSRVGVFLVKDLDDSGMDLEDAVSGTSLSVLLPDRNRNVESGDTLLGRLLPVPGTDQWIATDAMERIAGSTIFDAFVEDIERNKLETGQEVIHPVGQRDLELLLDMARGYEAGSSGSADLELLEGRLSDLLDGTSSVIPSPEEICGALEASPSPGPVVEPLLEDLAFHTEVEIDAVRILMLELWTAYHAQGHAPATPATDLPTAPDSSTTTPVVPVSELGAKLLAELEAAEEQGVATEEIFERLEQMIEGRSSSPEVDGPPEEIEWVTPDPGNVDALLAEYLWERESIGKPVHANAAKRLAGFADQLRESKIINVENLDELSLAQTLVQPWAEGRIEGVHELMCDLVEWEAWLVDVQEVDFGVKLLEFRDALIGESERLAKIEGEMPTEEPGDVPPQVSSWHVLNDPKGAWVLESELGRRTWSQDSEFVVGDLILGALGKREFLPGYRLLPRLLARGLLPLE